jgi:hypothetical protein
MISRQTIVDRLHFTLDIPAGYSLVYDRQALISRAAEILEIPPAASIAYDRKAVIRRVLDVLRPPAAGAALANSSVTSRAREVLSDTVPPFRWSDKQLAEFVSDGLRELKTIRDDIGDTVPDNFESAIANYTVYRALALDNDAQNNNGALSDKYLNLFISQVQTVRRFFSESKIGDLVNEGIKQLMSMRSDLTSAADVPEEFSDALADYALARANEISGDNASKDHYYALFSAKAAIPKYFYSNAQLSEFLDNAIQQLKNIRPDVDRLNAIPGIFSEALVDHIVYQACQFGTNPKSQNNSSAAYLNSFINKSREIPYVFTDGELSEYIDSAVADLIAMRPDLRIADDGGMKTFAPGQAEYDLPERFTDALLFHAAYNAFQHSQNQSMNFYFEKFQGAWKSL